MNTRKYISSFTGLMKIMMPRENLKKFVVVDIIKNPSKQYSYFSDINFVKAIAEMENGQEKEYNLVMKIGKTNFDQFSNWTMLIRNLYDRENYLYTKLLPNFVQFEEERGIQPVFDNVPKCFGSYMNPQREVIVLDDFMFKNSTPAILDWQFAAYNSPVYDLSDLLYSCASKEDLSQDLRRLFEVYRKSFTTHLEDLDSDPSKSSMSDMIVDRHYIAEYGLMRSFTIMKNTFNGVDNVADMDDKYESGQELSQILTKIDIPDEKKKKFADRVIFSEVRLHMVLLNYFIISMA